MSQDSEIEWTDATWNAIRGCTKISPGCKNCYAETFAERWRGVPGHPYEQGFDLRLVPEKLTEPLKWKKPRRVFVNSMSDLFHEGVPNHFIDDVFAVMALAKNHTFQILTKRPERMRQYTQNIAGMDNVPHAAERIHAEFSGEWVQCWDLLDKEEEDVLPLPNVWLGVSIEDQKRADERIPILLQTPAAVRFLSCEPLLGAVDLRPWLLRCDECGSPVAYDAACQDCGERSGEHSLRLDWVIVGGESGPGARPCDVAWIRSIVEQCRAAGVACFVKQLGSNPVFRELTFADGGAEPLGLIDKKGSDPAEWPEDLRVREFPRASVPT